MIINRFVDLTGWCIMVAEANKKQKHTAINRASHQLIIRMRVLAAPFISPIIANYGRSVKDLLCDGAGGQS